MNLTYHVAVQSEIEEATLWYADQDQNVALTFTIEVARTLSDVAESPLSYPRYGTMKVRRARVAGFPHGVFFVVRASDIYVVAVAHGRRRPAYWRSRL